GSKVAASSGAASSRGRSGSGNGASRGSSYHGASADPPPSVGPDSHLEHTETGREGQDEEGTAEDAGDAEEGKGRSRARSPYRHPPTHPDCPLRQNALERHRRVIARLLPIPPERCHPCPCPCPCPCPNAAPLPSGRRRKL